MPDAVIIGGVNGAGKTSFARRYVPNAYPDAAFLNADEIQHRDAAHANPIAAGKELLRRLEARVAARESFTLETTLSSTMYARRIAEWRAAGYGVVLHFIDIEAVEIALARVAKRVAEGGHGVPEADIRRRFVRGHDLFERIYKPVVDLWYHWRNDDQGFSLVEESNSPDS